MSFVSVGITGLGELDQAKCVVLERNGSKLAFKKAETINNKDLMSFVGGRDFLVSYDSYDFTSLSLNVPPVKDAVTLEGYIRKNSSEQLDSEREYLFVFWPSKAQGEGLGTDYEIHAVPDDYFNPDIEWVSEKANKKLDKFGVSQISLAGLSKIYFPGQTVFHAYADEKNIVVTVSKGKEILYTRHSSVEARAEEEDFVEEPVTGIDFASEMPGAVQDSASSLLVSNEDLLDSYSDSEATSDEPKVFSMLPSDEPAKSEEPKKIKMSFLNSYYENINLTYMYIVQNRRMPIDCIVLSGKLAYDEKLAELIAEFSDKPQLVLLPGKALSGCSHEDFQENILPIGNSVTPDEWDFRPVELKRNSALKSVILGANIFLIIAILVTLYFNVSSYSDLYGKKSLISSKIQLYKSRLSGLLTRTTDIENKKYSLAYIKGVDKREKSSIRLFPAIMPILDIAGYDSVEVYNNEKGRIINIKGTRQFKSIMEVQNFKREMDSVLKKVSERNSLKLTDLSSYNWNSFLASLSIKLSEGGGVEMIKPAGVRNAK